MRNVCVLFIAVMVFSGCASKLPLKSKTYKTLYEEKPLTVLVMPPINKSVKVEAKELFYSSLAEPITLQGYYVLPPLLTMEILKEESAYDSEMFQNNSMKKFGEIFGADAVLFTIIHDWRKTTIASQVCVKIEYVLKSTKTDEILFNRIGDLTLSVRMNSGNVFADLVGGMLLTALTKEIVVGRNCNFYTLQDIPAGKYSPLFQKDRETKAQPKEFKSVIYAQ